MLISLSSYFSWFKWMVLEPTVICQSPLTSLPGRRRPEGNPVWLSHPATAQDILSTVEVRTWEEGIGIFLQHFFKCAHCSHWYLGKSICANIWKRIDRQENFKLFCEPQLQLESFLLWQRWKGAIQNYKKVLEASIVNAKGKTCNLHIGLSSKTTNNHLWTAPSAGQKDILCDLSHPHGPKTYFNGQQEENELIKNSKSKRGQQNYLQTPYLFTWLEILAVKMWEMAWRGIIFNIV